MRPLSRACGGASGLGALSAAEFAERAPPASLCSAPSPASGRGNAARRVIIGCTYPLAAPALENRLRIRIDRVSQTSR